MTRVLFLLAFVGCAASLAPLDSGSLLTTSGQPMHWEPHRFPLSVMVDSSMPLMHQRVAFDAMSEWEAQTQRSLFAPIHANPNFLMFFGIPMLDYVTIQTKELGKNDRGFVRGLTELNMQPGEAGRQGSIHSVFVWLDDDLSDSTVAERVAIHEFGHVLGLRHDVRDPQSIMWYTVDFGTQTIQAEDIQTVQRMVDGL